MNNSVKSGRSDRSRGGIPLCLCRCQLLPAATKLGQGNIFTSVCQEFCPQGGRVSASVHAGIYPLDQADTPRTWWTPPGLVDTPPLDQADPPGPGRHPPDLADTPQTRQIHPRDQADTPPEADSRIRSTSGRYASYWNAFLFREVYTFQQGSVILNSHLPIQFKL